MFRRKPATCSRRRPELQARGGSDFLEQETVSWTEADRQFSGLPKEPGTWGGDGELIAARKEKLRSSKKLP